MDVAALQTGHEYTSHNKWRDLGSIAATSGQGSPPSQSLAERAIKAYQRAHREYDKQSFWSTIFNKFHGQSHAALMSGDIDAVIAIWSDPAEHNCFHGFDILLPAHVQTRFRSSSVYAQRAG